VVRSVLIIPVGITKETVEGVLKIIQDVKAIITITTEGFEERKRDILIGVSEAAKLIGAVHEHIIVKNNDRLASARIYGTVMKYKPSRIIVSGLTGSRYLYPIITQAVLRLWHDTKAEIFLIHGVEGGKWEIVPLLGFYIYNLKREQKRLFKLIYEHPSDILRTKEDLFEKYRLTKSSYEALKELESKGLIKRRRNRIEKTFPGHLLYNLLKEAGELQ